MAEGPPSGAGPGPGPAAGGLYPLTFGALGIALAAVLHEIKLFAMPLGGSVTCAGAVPIVCVARTVGLRWGLLAGAGLGVLRALRSGHVYDPRQGILDYPVAYGCLGLAALTPWPALGLVLATGVRFACHVCSGVLFFSGSAIERGWAPWAYSLAYNSFLVPDLVFALLALWAIEGRAPSLLGRGQRAPTITTAAVVAAAVVVGGYCVVLGRWVVGGR